METELEQLAGAAVLEDTVDADVKEVDDALRNEMAGPVEELRRNVEATERRREEL